MRVWCSPAGNAAPREGRGGEETPDLSPTALQSQGGSSLWTNPPGRSRAGSPGGAVHRISSWGHGMGWRGLKVGQEVRRGERRAQDHRVWPGITGSQGPRLKRHITSLSLSVLIQRKWLYPVIVWIVYPQNSYAEVLAPRNWEYDPIFKWCPCRCN